MAQINLDSYQSVRVSYFVRWDIENYRTTPGGASSSVTETFTDHNEVRTLLFPDIGLTTFTPLGKLLSISSSQHALRGTSNQVSMSISGIPNTEIGGILYSDLRGTVVRIYKGFFDISSGNQIGNYQGRFFGFVNRYSIDEEYNFYDKNQNVSLVIDCSSFTQYLDSKRNARQTNPDSMRNYSPLDSSFDRVPGLKNAEYDFGKSRFDGTEFFDIILDKATGAIV